MSGDAQVVRPPKERRACSNDELLWKLIMLLDVITFCVAFSIGCLMLATTCALTPPQSPTMLPNTTNGTIGTANSTSGQPPQPPYAPSPQLLGHADLLFYVKRNESQGCTAPGEADSTGTAYPWAMLLSTLAFAFGKLTTHALRLITLVTASAEWEAGCCARGWKSLALHLLLLLRFLVGQGVAVLLLLHASLMYAPSLDAFTVARTPSLVAFQWVVIVAPSVVLLVLCCGCAAASFGDGWDINCDGSGDGLVGPLSVVVLPCFLGLVAFGVHTILHEMVLPLHLLVTNLTFADVAAPEAAASLLVGSQGSLESLLRGFLLLPPTTLPATSGLGVFSPLFVSLVALNIMQLVVLLLASVGPPLLKRLRTRQRRRGPVAVRGGGGTDRA